MKNFILLGLVALSLAASSCGKMYTCKCPSGTKVSVVSKYEEDAAAECEAQSGGRCTY